MKTKTIPLSRYKKLKTLKRLVQEWTRAEVMARSPAIYWPEYGDYFAIKIQKADEIRKFLYGTDNLIEIGEQLGLPVDPKRKRRHGNKTLKADPQKFRKAPKTRS